MATKNNPKAENNKSPLETWRKPLQVPPRTNAMRSFYQGAGDDSAETAESEKQTTVTDEAKTETKKPERKSESPKPEKANREAVQVKQQPEQSAAIADGRAVYESNSETSQSNKLTKEELTQKLGIEIEDLFDVHELLRGKSFDIYHTLMESADENGRCKITQPELMKRTGIKNRRTFYKHEDWLIGLRLLEKRHLPGDHKGVVYRVLKMSEVLPVSNIVLEKFEGRLKTIG